jgi:ribonuclease Z
MTIEITFLGTAAMVPTADRNHSAILIYHEKDSILFDCGENTQRQLKIAKADIARISKICISHWHGDHVLGLPGLLQTMNMMSEQKTIEIFGPVGTKKRMEFMLKAFESDMSSLKMKIHEIENDGIFYENDFYKLEAYHLNHSVKTLGFAFIEQDKRKMNLEFVKKKKIPEGPLLGKLQRGEDITFKNEKILVDDATYVVKGRKIAYISDSEPNKNSIILAQDSDLLISESTYATKLEEKGEEYKHMTAKQAAQVAHQANVKELILTHFSQRYKSTEEILENATDIFPRTKAAFDFMKVRL